MENLRGKKILDAGTGDGAFVEDLRKLKIDIQGVDVFLSAEQKKRNYFIEADIKDTGLPSNSFDLVVSSYSIFHYFFQPPPYQAALRELHGILKPGGRLLLIKAAYGLNEIKAASQFKIIFPPNQDMHFQYFLLEKSKRKEDS